MATNLKKNKQTKINPDTNLGGNISKRTFLFPRLTSRGGWQVLTEMHHFKEDSENWRPLQNVRSPNKSIPGSLPAHGTVHWKSIKSSHSVEAQSHCLPLPPEADFCQVENEVSFTLLSDTTLQHHRIVVLCGKPTSCLNKWAHTGFSGHIMESFLFYTKIIPHLTHQWSHLSSTASELKRNCVIKGCEKNHTGCSSDPLLLLHLIHNKPNKYAYPGSKFHYLISLSLVKVFLYYPSCYSV